MKTLILAYNPKYIDSKILQELRNEYYTVYGYNITLIPHLDSAAQPLYTVQHININGNP